MKAAVLMILLLAASSSAYEYWHFDSSRLPTVYGPFPREYLLFDSASLTYDDYRGYDSFVGYRDLDLYYPDGRVQVIRSDYYTELDRSEIDTDYELFGSHVYGMLPGGVVYKKHYGHDHDYDYLDYGYSDYYPGYYGYGANYYDSYYYQESKPIRTCYSEPGRTCSIWR